MCSCSVSRTCISHCLAIDGAFKNLKSASEPVQSTQPREMFSILLSLLLVCDVCSANVFDPLRGDPCRLNQIFSARVVCLGGVTGSASPLLYKIQPKNLATEISCARDWTRVPLLHTNQFCGHNAALLPQGLSLTSTARVRCTAAGWRTCLCLKALLLERATCVNTHEKIKFSPSCRSVGLSTSRG